MNKKNLYIGWDIGGAHTKYTILKDNSMVLSSKISPLRLWESLSPLKTVIDNVYNTYGQNFIINNAISMSGEMCDIFTDRKHGVEKILSLFDRKKMNNYIYSSKDDILPISEYKNYKHIASMNWHIVAKYLSPIRKYAIAIDLGSTTTDFILLKNYRCINKRVDDYTGLQSSELLYTGILRTPIFSVTKQIRFNAQTYSLIPEYYATMGDIYRVLGVISTKDDYSETADGRSKSEINSLKRISRIFGMDYTNKEKKLIISLSKKIMTEHFNQISYNINYHINKNFKNIKDLHFVGMGIGKTIIKKICIKNKWHYTDLDKSLSNSFTNNIDDLSNTAPSFLLALLLKKSYE